MSDGQHIRQFKKIVPNAERPRCYTCGKMLKPQFTWERHPENAIPEWAVRYSGYNYREANDPTGVSMLTVVVWTGGYHGYCPLNPEDALDKHVHAFCRQRCGLEFALAAIKAGAVYDRVNTRMMLTAETVKLQLEDSNSPYMLSQKYGE